MPNYSDPRPTLVVDSECYRNYWSIAFRDAEGTRVKIFELYEGNPLDRASIAKLIRNWRIVTFNGLNYDAPMIALAMSGATNSQLKHANDDIFHADLRPWQFADKYGVSMPDFFDHIDLMNVSPGAARQPSLKLYGGMLHSKRMQDLPFDPDLIVTPEMRTVLRSYVVNDLDITNDLYHELKPQLAIRAHMSDVYGMDLRSKSDAQLAEAIIKLKVEQRMGRKLYKEDIKPGVFHFEVPEFIRFETPYMQGVLDRVRGAKFVIRRDGYVELPDVMKQLVVIDGRGYKMGIGGLHSTEERQTVYADDDTEIEDRDVRGYYPNLILGSGRGPANMGPHFQPVYRGIVDDREVAKDRIKICEKANDTIGAKGAKDEAETGKIMSNGAFGKGGSPHSPLYAPKMMIQTTVGGQLSILMAIERTTEAGYRVVSANTDGFVTVRPRSQRDMFAAIMWDWECDTGLITEDTHYASIHSRDVNNYIAIKTDGKVKTKGIFAASGRGLPAAAGLKKNPDVDVCSQAVVAYLTKGMPIEDTVRRCADVRQFIRIRKDKYGASYRSTVDSSFDSDYVGKAVRWYYAEGEQGAFQSVETGGRVAGTTGARPLMELPDDFELPDDVDFDWYIREAYARLYDVGVDCPDPTLAGRTGTALANKPGLKTVHIVDMTTGVALCGAKRDDRRDVWEEHTRLPVDRKLCAKCRREQEL